MSVHRMADDSGRLVHHDDIFIFVKNLRLLRPLRERDALAFGKAQGQGISDPHMIVDPHRTAV